MSRILIVEPNARIGALVSGQLRQEGYEAEDVRNGVEAAMALRAQIANLILLDSEVPLGGLRAARIFRLHDKYNTIPMILSPPQDRERAQDIIRRERETGLVTTLIRSWRRPSKPARSIRRLTSRSRRRSAS